MIFGKSIALPVIVAFAIFCTESVRAGDVRLFNDNQDEINVGDVWSDKTTVGELKRIVSNKIGNGLDRVRLATIKSDTLLEDEKLLSDYISIYEDGLLLRLCDDLQEPGQVSVNFADRKFEIIVSKDKTLDWLKKEALGEENPNLYRVFYHGRELKDDSKTLGELQFYKGANVNIWKKNESFKITVTCYDQKREFDVTLDMDVDDLRRLIRESKINEENRLLVHNGKVLEEHKKLFSHSIHPFFYGFHVQVLEKVTDYGEKITLFYKKSNHIVQYVVNVKSSMSVRQLKEFAFKIDNSIPVENMQLKLIDTELNGDSRTLSEFDLYKGAWIRVSEQSN